MSVLIKSMEMPKNCFDCMFHWHGDGTTYCLAQSKMHDLHHIKWQCNGYEEQMKYREPTCPLVPVPPHGRLIDADALEAYTDDKYSLHEIGRHERDSIVDSLRYCAPTIIKAEEGER